MLRALLAVLSAVFVLVAAPLLAAQATLAAADASAPSFALWVWALTGLAALIGMVVFGLTVGRRAGARRARIVESAEESDSALDVPAGASFA